MSFRVRSGAAEMRSAELTSFRQSSSTPLSRRSAAIRTFRSMVKGYWKEQGRHNLPWRKTRDPYKILVSEIMLQQTQVERVIPYYQKFLKVFPNIQVLAKVSLADVLKIWSGLGYNRRAKYLRDTAIEIVEKHNGQVPADYDSLRALSGVGDYTARAVRVFALGKPDVLIETNIRTVFIHHFFSNVPYISDREILEQTELVAQEQNPREWHWALMDYGAYLKASGVRVNVRGAHYSKQSRFEGSLRQIRGAILRTLNGTRRTEEELRSDLEGFLRSDLVKFKLALASLARDGLVTRGSGGWRIA